MSTLLLDAFPGGKRKALVMSYDDGRGEDRQLVEILNRHGIPGTFHLNSGFLDRPNYLTRTEVPSLFAGHEVSVHTVSHPHLPHLPAERIVQEIMDDRRALEDLVGYPVRGMSYPGGGYDDRVVAMLPHLGIEYARTVHNQESFDLPADFLRWPASCHHRRAIERGRQFQQVPPRWSTQVLYVWGHSYELPSAQGWDMIEEFCAMLGRDSSIWRCTHIQLVDYMAALRRSKCSADGMVVHNPSAMAVWVTFQERIRSIAPGQTVDLRQAPA